jgi:hypothetical protein
VGAGEVLGAAGPAERRRNEDHGQDGEHDPHRELQRLLGSRLVEREERDEEGEELRERPPLRLGCVGRVASSELRLFTGERPEKPTTVIAQKTVAVMAANDTAIPTAPMVVESGSAADRPAARAKSAPNTSTADDTNTIVLVRRRGRSGSIGGIGSGARRRRSARRRRTLPPNAFAAMYATAAPIVRVATPNGAPPVTARPISRRSAETVTAPTTTTNTREARRPSRAEGSRREITGTTPAQNPAAHSATIATVNGVIALPATPRSGRAIAVAVMTARPMAVDRTSETILIRTGLQMRRR